MQTARLDKLFTIKYGDHTLNNKENLGEGNTVVISSQGIDNGCYGFFDVLAKYQPPIISVPRTGSIAEAFVQLHQCNIDDNCLVLKPKEELPIDYLFYVASAIRFEKWRYLYGRQVTPYRIGKLEVISKEYFQTSLSYNNLICNRTPNKNTVEKGSIQKIQLKNFGISELFVLERGHFHAIDRLKKGRYPTISRVGNDNGLVGFYDKPNKAKIFSRFLITVSTVTGDSFLQYQDFIATDNVVICKPKQEMRITSLIYIQAVLNKTKWRYSYGRQCYKRILQKTILPLPVTDKKVLDEDYMENIVTQQPYWQALKENLIK
ncbi:MAG: restriction endonuclease subunit S [Bacteroidales bacterium]|nr:restriction endonuclease subunit S [Bacteroidales bacterium]